MAALRILLVEDEAAIRELSSQLLTSCDYTVLEAEHGERALQVARDFAGKIDIIVTDVMIPVMNATTMLEKLSAERGQLKVVFVSGYNNQGIQVESSGSASSTYLTKPFKLTDLAQAVRNVLDAKV